MDRERMETQNKNKIDSREYWVGKGALGIPVLNLKWGWFKKNERFSPYIPLEEKKKTKPNQTTEQHPPPLLI